MDDAPPARGTGGPEMSSGTNPSGIGVTTPMGSGHFVYGQTSENRQRIESEFSRIIEWEFQAMPISDAFGFISESHQIPIRIDEGALSDLGVFLDDEITFTTSGVPMRDAIELILDDVGGSDLSYIIKNDVLMITSVTDAEDSMETRLYDMRHYQGLDPSAAIEIIQEGTTSEWEDIDHAGGTIVPIQGGLMVRQNQRVHREIAAVLEQVRQFTAAGLETPSQWLDGSTGGPSGMFGGRMGSVPGYTHGAASDPTSPPMGGTGPNTGEVFSGSPPPGVGGSQGGGPVGPMGGTYDYAPPLPGDPPTGGSYGTGRTADAIPDPQ
jgi:hypothetical protein